MATRSYSALYMDCRSLEGRCGVVDDGVGGVVVEESWDILSVGTHLYAPCARATFRLATVAGDEKTQKFSKGSCVESTTPDLTCVQAKEGLQLQHARQPVPD